MLDLYTQRLERLLGDPKQTDYNPGDLLDYINQARNWVAAKGECIRVTPPLVGSIASIRVLTGGTGYVAPVVSILDPTGAGAVAGAVTLSGGVITAIALNAGGAGYSLPSISIADAAGTGGSAAPVTNANITVQGQEVYPFSALNLSGSPGVAAVLAVKGVTMLWGTFQYTTTRVSFSKYQALVRNYTSGYQYIPAVAAQFGQGVSGSLYLYPIPSQSYPMTWDCICLPLPLASDADVEAIPQPWTDAVPFYAAYLAFNEQFRTQDSDRMREIAVRYMLEARAFSEPSMVANWYGRA